MREILYRGLVKQKMADGEIFKKWIYGCPLDYAGGAQIWERDEFGARNNCIVDPETRGEYTGLTDSNGKKIFEGDIVSFWDGTIYECLDGDIEMDTQPGRKFKKCPKKRREIVFDNGAFRLKNNNNLGCFLDSETEIEVIGNIHDDTNLLEGTE
jgi:uncharacterized phage protein (TIGR01671 family)